MKRNIFALCNTVLCLSLLLWSCKKDESNKPELDGLTDAVLYIGQDFNGDEAVCVMLPDMSKKTVLFSDIEKLALSHPVSADVSPSGSRMLICNDILIATGQASLNIWDIEHPRLFRLAGFDAINAASPVYTPDENRVVYVNTSTSSIEIVNVDGEERTVLFAPAAGNKADYPSVTQDGQKIVFRYLENNKSCIYVMNINGTNPVKVKDGNDGYSYLDPKAVSNNKIVYVKDNPANPDIDRATICVCDIDGANEQRIVPGGSYNRPSINNAGTILLYRNNINNKWVIAKLLGNTVSNLQTLNGIINKNMTFCRIDPKYVSGNPEPRD